MLSTRALTPLVLFAVMAQGAPWPAEVKHTTHRTHRIARGVEVEAYHPESTLETFHDGTTLTLTKRDEVEATIEEAAADFVADHLGFKNEEVHVRSTSEGSISRYLYFQQKIDGIPVINAVSNLVIARGSPRVQSLGANFVKPSRVADKNPKVTEAEAVAAAEAVLDGTKVDYPVEIQYFINDRDEARLAYVFQVETAANSEDYHWYEVVVDAANASILSVNDYVSQATYTALGVDRVDPREGFRSLVDPENTAASPNGWLTIGSTSYTDTQGNNVIAYKSSTTGTTSQSSSGVFNYPWDSTSAPSSTANLNNARVNAFVTGNQIHDIAYLYGFTESAYNFQQENFGKGGAESDRVQISVQDSSGTNNANFATPRDGQRGQMRMYIWTYTTPNRDGDIENDVIVHEYCHGITNRMTGGGTGTCLGTTEAGGLGEGWSDALSLWMRASSSARPDYVLGEWVTNNVKGIRAYPYSTSKTTNPYTYASMATMTQVHAIGTVWSTILYSVYDALVAAQGFSATAKTDPSGTAGNVIWLHLFLDALRIQPCSPTFLTARDAWITAETNRYGGAYKCIVWKGFANRGLGVGAVRGTDSFAVPSGC